MDDIIDSGGTIINAVDALKKKGAKEVYVFITHAVLSGDAAKKIKNSNPFWKTEIYFPRDVHFNKKGNNLYSDRIYIEAFR